MLYANATLLVPSYPGVTPHLEDEALTIFEHLLPEWRIVPIDCNQLIGLGGGIHCVTLNLARIARLPPPIDPRDLPEAGGVFPGDEALPPRRLVAADEGWRPFGSEPAADGPDRLTLRRVSDLDIADECSVCCATDVEPPAARPAARNRRGAFETDRRSSPAWSAAGGE